MPTSVQHLFLSADIYYSIRNYFERNMNFCVVGAGVVGLTTALELQKEYRNANVTILADKLLKDTTSDVAAGIFRPGISFSGPTPEITRYELKFLQGKGGKI